MGTTGGNRRTAVKSWSWRPRSFVTMLVDWRIATRFGSVAVAGSNCVGVVTCDSIPGTLVSWSCGLILGVAVVGAIVS